MKVIVVCGWHLNETAGIYMKDDWMRSSRKIKENGKEVIVYNELSRLADRTRNNPLTDKEVILENVSQYTAHKLAKKFMDKWPLEKLLRLYRAESKFPAKYQPLLERYLKLWEGMDIAKEEHKKELSKQFTNLYYEVIKNPIWCHSNYFGATKIFIFPKELETFVLSNNFANIPEHYVEIPPLKEKLRLYPDAVILDIHMNGNVKNDWQEENCKGWPYISEDVFMGKKISESGYNALVKRLKKYTFSRNGAKECEPKKMYSDYDFSCLVVEIPYKYEKIKDSEFYKKIDVKVNSFDNFVSTQEVFKAPNVAFLEFWNRLVLAAHGYDDSLPRFGIIFEMVGLYTRAPLGLYGTEEYKEAKQYVANVIKDVLDWSEEYAAIVSMGKNNAKN